MSPNQPSSARRIVSRNVIDKKQLELLEEKSLTFLCYGGTLIIDIG